MNRFAFGTAMSYLRTSLHKIETFKNQDNETSITASSPMQEKMAASNCCHVSVSYRSRIILRSSFVAPFFVVLSFSLPEAETIRKQYGTIRKHCGVDTRTIGGAREDHRRRTSPKSRPCLPDRLLVKIVVLIWFSSFSRHFP